MENEEQIASVKQQGVRMSSRQEFSKRYGSFEAVRDVSLNVKEGELVARLVLPDPARQRCSASSQGLSNPTPGQSC